MVEARGDVCSVSGGGGVGNMKMFKLKAEKYEFSTTFLTYI